MPTTYAQGYYQEASFSQSTQAWAATSIGAFGSGTNIMGLWANSENTIYATKYSNPGNLYKLIQHLVTLVGSEGAMEISPTAAINGLPTAVGLGLIHQHSSATYDASTGYTVTGTNLAAYAGAANDIDVSKLTIAGEGAHIHPHF